MKRTGLLVGLIGLIGCWLIYLGWMNGQSRIDAYEALESSCASEGGQAVRAMGDRVVCVEPSAVKWVRDVRP